MDWPAFVVIIEESLAVDTGAVEPGALLRDLGDSLSLLILMYRLEECGVSVDEHFFERIMTVQDAWNLALLSSSGTDL